MSRPIIPRRSILLRTLLLVLGTASSAGAIAADGFSPAVEFAMQRDLGIFPAQVPQYLAAERLASAHDAVARRQAGDRYAGSWIERRPDGAFQAVLAATAIGTLRAAPGVEVRAVRNSLRELDAAVGRLNELGMRAVDGKAALSRVRGWHVDVVRNTVVVSVAPDAVAEGVDLVAASGMTTKRRIKMITKPISGKDSTSALTTLFHMKSSTASFTLSRDTFMLTRPSGVPAGTW